MSLNVLRDIVHINNAQLHIINEDIYGKIDDNNVRFIIIVQVSVTHNIHSIVFM